MSKFNQYLHQSLAATGFCILDSSLACTLRPDLWGNGLECAGDFGAKMKAGLTPPQGAEPYLLRLKGAGQDLTLFARSPLLLAQRIEWTTGREVSELVPLAQLHGDLGPGAVARPDRAPADDRGDQYGGIVTHEPGRTCSDCDHTSTTGSCRKPEVSGIDRPLLRAERRCPAFKPYFDSLDQRTGRQLWPELEAAQEVAN